MCCKRSRCSRSRNTRWSTLSWSRIVSMTWFWNMDVQVAKLKDGAQQAGQVEETVNRIEVLTNDTVARLDEATKSKEAFTRELDKLEQGRSELTDFVRGYFERLSVERKELDAFGERLKSLHTGLTNSEATINSLQEREKDLGALGQRTDGLEKRMADLMGQAEDLQGRQAELETLRDRLAQVDELTKRTGYQFEALEKSREDLEGAAQGDAGVLQDPRRDRQDHRNTGSRQEGVRGVPPANRRVSPRDPGPRLENGCHYVETVGGRRGKPEGGNPRRGRRRSRPSDDAACRPSATGSQGRDTAQHPEDAEHGSRQPDAGAGGAPRRGRIPQESLRRLGDTGDGCAAAGRRHQCDPSRSCYR